MIAEIHIHTYIHTCFAIFSPKMQHLLQRYKISKILKIECWMHFMMSLLSQRSCYLKGNNLGPKLHGEFRLKVVREKYEIFDTYNGF